MKFTAEEIVILIKELKSEARYMEEHYHKSGAGFLEVREAYELKIKQIAYDWLLSLIEDEKFQKIAVETIVLYRIKEGKNGIKGNN